MILSFSLTSKLARERGIPDPLYTHVKTVSRRSWSNKHAATWIKAYKEGRIVHDAWSNAPFVKGACKIGTFKLTCEPYLEYLQDMPESDVLLEGGFWETAQDYIREFSNGDDNQTVWVIRWEDFKPIQNLREFK